MNKREEYLKTIARQQAKPIPYFFKLCKAVEDKFEAKYGHTNYPDFYDIPLREVFIRPTKLNIEDRFTKYLSSREVQGDITEWGIELKKSSVEHFSTMIGPLHDALDLQDIEDLPLPDFLEDYRWEGVAQEIQTLKEQGKITFTGIYGGHDTGGSANIVPAFMDIFESAWYLRGLDNMLMDFYLREEFAVKLLDKVTELKVQLAKKWTSAGIDIIVTADDVGTQKGLMMSPDIYRKLIKPRLGKVIDAAKSVNEDVLIFYHSDGDIEEIIPDLIEIGVQILNPIQPECMDPKKVKSQYIDKISFWGTVGTQTTLPFGTPEEVKAFCSEMMSHVSKTGGLVLGPTHLVEPEVPLENIEAYLEAIKEHNQ